MTKRDDLMDEICKNECATSSSSRTNHHLLHRLPSQFLLQSPKYVDTHLTPHDEPNTVKYEINGTSLTLSSCLTFPNGKKSQCRNEGMHEKGIVMTSSLNIVRGSKGIGVGGGVSHEGWWKVLLLVERWRILIIGVQLVGEMLSGK
jgi:hypothetical protein